MPRDTADTKNKSSGMRIQLKGLRTTRDMRAMLHEAIDHLENLGITHVRASNFSTTPAHEDGTPLTRLARNRKIQDHVIAHPYRSAADEHGL